MQSLALIDDYQMVRGNVPGHQSAHVSFVTSQK
jgi:hypothetical protein